MRLRALVVASALFATGCDGCSRSRSDGADRPLAPGTSPGAPVHDPDVEIVYEEARDDARTRNITGSDIALSNDEIFWIDVAGTRVLALPKSAGDAGVPRVVEEAEGGRIAGIASSTHGVYVAVASGWRGTILHVLESSRIEIARAETRFFAMVSNEIGPSTEGVTFLEADGISIAKRGAPQVRIASFDFGGHLTACPFGAVWLATRIPGVEAGSPGLDELADARAHRASSIVVYRAAGGVTTLVSNIVDDRFGDVACDTDSVYWSDMAGIHRTLANGNGTPVIVVKPPTALKLQAIGTALYWDTSSGLQRHLLAGDAGAFETFTKDDAQILGRPIADASHVYWLTPRGVRRKRR